MVGSCQLLGGDGPLRNELVYVRLEEEAHLHLRRHSLRSGAPISALVRTPSSEAAVATSMGATAKRSKAMKGRPIAAALPIAGGKLALAGHPRCYTQRWPLGVVHRLMEPGWLAAWAVSPSPLNQDSPIRMGIP